LGSTQRAKLSRIVPCIQMDLPTEVCLKILEGQGARVLLRVGITSNTLEIARVARALTAARQDAAVQWCHARFQEFAAIHTAMLEAVWDGDDFKPAVRPRDHFLPHEDTIPILQQAIEDVARPYEAVHVRYDPFLLPTGGGRHRWARVRVILESSMPSPIPGREEETLDLGVTFTFERRQRQYLLAWHLHNQVGVALGSPSLELRWMVRQAWPVLDWQHVDPVWNPYATARSCAVRHDSHAAEFLADPLAVVKACFSEGVTRLCARQLNEACVVPGSKARSIL
jgi:hypothetical protein